MFGVSTNSANGQLDEEGEAQGERERQKPSAMRNGNQSFPKTHGSKGTSHNQLQKSPLLLDSNSVSDSIQLRKASIHANAIRSKMARAKPLPMQR